MIEKTTNVITSLLKYAIAGVSGAYIVYFLVLAAIRIPYPFELEWMEGSTVDHVIRVATGLPLYCEPSLDFIPFRYAPLYYYVSAAVSAITGVGFVPLRLVSMLATIGCFVMIFLLVRRETESWFLGLLASGFFAATYPISGTWFDLGRVDMLFMLLLLAGLYVIRFHISLRSAILAGVLMSLCFLTKQLALMIVLPLLLYYLLIDRRLGTIFVCTMTFLIVGSSLVLEAFYDGWYYFYVFGMGKSISYSGTLLGRLWPFARVFVFNPFKIASLLGLFFLLWQLFRGRTLRARLFYAAAFVGMMGAAFLTRISAGAFHHNLIPGHAIMAILFALGAHALVCVANQGGGLLKRAAKPAVYSICLVQLVAIWYSSEKLLPTEADRQAGHEFVELLRSFDGEVMVPFHGYIPTFAGKKIHANRMALVDVERRTKGRPREKLRSEIRQAFQTKRWSAIILDHTWHEMEREGHYVSTGPVFEDTTVFWPVTGWHIRPQTIWVPAKE